MDFTSGEFDENQLRVEHLISAAKVLQVADPILAPLAHDVLRAAVVFLHSSLEEVIRNLYIRRLPNVNPTNLNEIPFLSQAATFRPVKIFLGDLVPYRGDFVENLIIKSIEAYADKFNLNNTTELVNCLKLAEIHNELFERYFPDLNALMARRHQIVHQMDRVNSLDPLASPLSDIDVQLVDKWKVALEEFVKELMEEYSKVVRSSQSRDGN